MLHTYVLCYTSAGTQTLTPQRKTHPLVCTLAVPPSPSSAPPSPLVVLPPPPCLFRGMRLAGCVWWPDSKSLSHSPKKFPPFFPFYWPDSAHLHTVLVRRVECIQHTHTHSLFGATAGTESISTLPYSFLPASPCSDLFQCVVANRVCVHLQPCPVKYRLFKEVSNIIWSLYCNYKVLLLEMAERREGELPTATCWVHLLS